MKQVLLLFALCILTISSQEIATCSFSDQTFQVLSGSIILTENIPFGVTFTLNISDPTDALSEVGNALHVHQYGINDGEDSCGVDVTGGHYNPILNYGEVSGVNGAIGVSQLQSYTAFMPDAALTGVYGIVGRSLVVHLDDGSRIGCCNVEIEGKTTDILKTAQENINDVYEVPSEAICNFDDHEFQSLGGLILLEEDEDGVTFTFSVSDPNENLTETGNALHIHQFGIDIDEDTCGPTVTGGHYNPILNYGEISGINGDISSAELDTYTATMADVSLTGEYGIIGRSLVIHKEGGARIGCCNIRFDDDRNTAIIKTAQDNVNEVYQEEIESSESSETGDDDDSSAAFIATSILFIASLFLQ